MRARLSWFLLLILLVSPALNAKDKDKDKKKSSLPELVLRARTVLVVIHPDAGEPLHQPTANATARENVEQALMNWGRLQPVMDGQVADLVIAVRTGTGRMVGPTVKGGPIDTRPTVMQPTDTGIRIGAQQGHAPPLNDPGMSSPRGGGPRISNEVGSSEDSFEVYLGTSQYPLDSSPVWRYVARDCLRAPTVSAVEQFRKAIAESEKLKPPKNP
ncbi:MAG: hypothetical protein DMG77_17135 [Acidobacteria bacterium]|nr:MAG: hypothetical protein DMG77_17135 [Acidobacteriota bacterium]